MGIGVPAPAGKVLAAIAQAALVLAASSAIAIGLTTSPSPLAAADGWIESVFPVLFAGTPAERPHCHHRHHGGDDRSTALPLARRSGLPGQDPGAMEAGQPEAIGLDLLFDQPTEPEKDQALRHVIDRAAMPVVFALTDLPPSASEERQRFCDAFLADRRLGDVQLLPERTFDETIHSYSARGPTGRPSFAAALAEAAGVAPPSVTTSIARGREDRSPRARSHRRSAARRRAGLSGRTGRRG
jgi:adenylate cyclase